MNKWIGVGNIVRDIELLETVSGVSFCNFTIAINRAYKDENGAFVTDFIRCVAWRNIAENLFKYARKGEKMLIQGSLEVNDRKDKDGNSRTYMSIRVTDFEFLGKRIGEEDSSTEKDTKVRKRQTVEFVDDDVDIPF